MGNIRSENEVELSSSEEERDLLLPVHADITLSHGERYVGEVVNGKPHGKGVSYRPDNSIHTEGTYENGKFTEGKLYHKNSVYTGTFQNGSLNGKGRVERRKYGIIFLKKGEFKNYKLNGTGEWYKNGTLSKKGTFKLDKLEGNGTRIYEDGSREVGIFEDDKLKYGFVYVVSENGDEYNVFDASGKYVRTEK